MGDMTGIFWIDMVFGLVFGLLLLWPTLLLALVVWRPKGGLLSEAVRLLPDVLRLLRSVAADKSMPGGVRIRISLVFAYLASPIDLVPDFVPAVGRRDDAILATAALRSIARQVGMGAIHHHWTGSPQGFAVLRELCDPEVIAAREPDYAERPTKPNQYP